MISQLAVFHHEIAKELFNDSNTDFIKSVFNHLNELRKESYDNYNFLYDQVVSLGEILSTKIISKFLKSTELRVEWIDARKIIRTNNCYRESEVNWSETEKLVNNCIDFKEVEIYVTQGFIGHTDDGETTTLGREGSDFSAGILAYCCNAESVTIWKDVAGMLNADPKWFDNTIKLDRISFREAIELSYYGASVIHPKTIKPLQNKQIPLYVKSFVNPNEEGTIIQASTADDHLIPSFIFKMNQILFSITPKDFSFLVEKNLSDIFSRLSQANAKINLMQNSALNFSILLDEDKIDVDQILSLFKDSYHVKFNGGLELVTIRHYDDSTINRVTVDKEILLQQKTRETARLIVRQL